MLAPTPARQPKLRLRLLALLKILLPAIVCLGIFNVGYSPKQTLAFRREYALHALPGPIWPLVRWYYSRQEDEVLYYEYSNLLSGHSTATQTGYASSVQMFRTVQPGVPMLPYRDFHAEYPPITYAWFLLPRLFGSSLELFRQCYFLQITLLLYAVTFASYRWRRAQGDRIHFARQCTIAAGFALAIGQLLTERMDLLPAALILFGAIAMWQRRYAHASIWWVLGMLTKLMPAVLLPLPFFERWKQDGWKSAVRMALPAAGVGCAIILPCLVMNPQGFLGMFTHHTARGLQIESVYATLLMVLHWVIPFTMSVATASMSDIIAGPLAQWLALWPTKLLLAGVITTLWWLLRRGWTREILIPVLLLPLFAFVGASPVASPQFVIWTLPLILGAAGTQGHRLRRAYLGYALATQCEYNIGYLAIGNLYPPSVLLLVLRWVAFSYLAYTALQQVRAAPRITAPRAADDA